MWLSFENLAVGYQTGAPVLENVNLRLGRGLWVVAGPNGSGKSSLLRCAAGVLRPRRGRLLWNGADVWSSPVAYRWLVGYAPQDVEELPDMPALRYLAYLAALKGIKPEHQRTRAAELLDAFGLPDRRLPTYSGGMKRRLAIAAALLNDPDILLLDEPAAGLAPEEKVALWNRLALLAADRIIVLATHLPEALAGVTDGRVLVQNKGVSLDADPH